jgi:hypothetical protein
MDTFDLRALSIAIIVAMLIAPAFALAGNRRVAAVVNAVLAAGFLSMTLPTLIEWASSQNAFVTRYGGAALGQLPLLATGAGLALTALVCSIVSFGQLRFIFWIGWVANIPPTLVLYYFAFLFHVF